MPATTPATVALTVAELKVGDVILWPAGHTSTVAAVRYTRKSAILRFRHGAGHEMRKSLGTKVRVLVADTTKAPGTFAELQAQEAASERDPKRVAQAEAGKMIEDAAAALTRAAGLIARAQVTLRNAGDHRYTGDLAHIRSVIEQDGDDETPTLAEWLLSLGD